MPGLFLLLLLLMLLPGSGIAQARQADENVTYGYAQVLRATPVYETTRSKVPEQRCDGPAAGGNRCRIVQVEREERRLAGFDIAKRPSSSRKAMNQGEQLLRDHALFARD